MATPPNVSTNKPVAYGSAKDLPSYRDLARQIQTYKLLTRFIARNQREAVLEIDQQLKRLARVVDDFYTRLGPRNWIYHDLLGLDKIERLLAEVADAEDAERRLVDMYRDADETKWWLSQLNAHPGLRARRTQIERARAHYDADQFDSCVLHLVAVMDGFVNDFQPEARQGLHARAPEDMVAWDSVVGHHMGLSHVMKTFGKTIKKRVDEEVFEVYRNGIMHGSVVRFDNVIVATKAWNMLFGVADWAAATTKASQPKDPRPSFSDTLSAIARHATYQKYQTEFVPSKLCPSDPSFATNQVVALSSEFLDAWEHGQWAIVARLMPPSVRRSRSSGAAIENTKDLFGDQPLAEWAITSVTFSQASTADIEATAIANGGESSFLRFRLIFWTDGGALGIPGQDEGAWSLAVWRPDSYFADDHAR